MKRVSNYVVKTYQYNDEYYIDVVTAEDYYEAWLFGKKIGVKSFLFGMPKEQVTYKEFLVYAEMDIEDEIETYEHELDMMEEAHMNELDGHKNQDENTEDENMTNKKIQEVYDRTYRNCQFYLAHGKEYSLANEIGVLRGITYCMEAVGMSVPSSLMGMVQIQQDLKAKDEAQDQQ